MSVSKKANGKGWMFQFRFEGKKIKKELNPFTKEIMRTKTECQVIERKYLEYLENEKNEKNDKKNKIFLYSLYNEYLKATKSNLKGTTAYRYYRFKDLFLSLMENKNIYDLTVNDFIEWKEKIIQTDNKKEYINRILNTMRGLLDYGITMYNLNGGLKYPFLEPYKKHEIIEHNEEKKKNISQNDFDLMLSKLDLTSTCDYHYYVILTLLYNTGLRIGELSALTISDYVDGSLRVNKDYVRVGGVDYIQPPKNENSRRIVQLDDRTRTLLDEYINKFKPKKVLFYYNDNYVRHQTIGRVMKKLATECSLQDVYKLSPHILRHSHASNLRAKGWNEYQVSKRLGNTPDVATTTYIHFDMPNINDIIK